MLAGVVASLACGLGALPLLIRRIDPARHTGLWYGFAGGLMFPASVYNLILPGLNMAAAGWCLKRVLPIVIGTLLGAAFLAFSVAHCFWVAVFTSLPQPLAAVPAVLLAWFFEPLMPLMIGFAAGAMIFLVVLELIHEALHTEKASRIAWAFIVGFCLMLWIQVVL